MTRTPAGNTGFASGGRTYKFGALCFYSSVVMPRGRSQLRKLNATSGRSSVYRNNSIKYNIIIL